MAVPSTRKEFKEYCLRALGKPVIEINVDDDQVEDRIDQAIRYYWDYHFDGTEKMYFKYQVDQQFIETGEIELPENIIGVVKIFEIGDPATSAKDIFNIRYQIALNDLYTLTNVGLLTYYMTMSHLGVMEELLVGKTPIRYNRHRNIVHVDKSTEHFTLGEFLMFEVYKVVDPEIYSDVWADRWLQYYTTQLIKRQWGSNLTKFEGIQLPGGVTFNGLKIYDDADAEIKRLEEEMINNYSLPVSDMVG
jgi:hypothetical protein